MKLTILGPNLPDQSKGTFHVHTADCADLKRGQYRMVSRFERHTEEHNSQRSVVEWMYGPAGGSFYEETWGDDIPADAWTHYQDEFWFAPCTKELPEEVLDHRVTVMVKVSVDVAAENAKRAADIIAHYIENGSTRDGLFEAFGGSNVPMELDSFYAIED